jgi:hypothetical protein
MSALEHIDVSEDSPQAVSSAALGYDRSHLHGSVNISDLALTSSNSRRHEYVGKCEVAHPIGKGEPPVEKCQENTSLHHPERPMDAGIGDPENGCVTPTPRCEVDPNDRAFTTLYRRYRSLFHLFIWLLFTG